MAKASACHGSAKTGASPEGWSASCRLKIALPGVDRNGQRRIGALAPDFGRREDHGVDPLRVLATAMRVAVRKHKTFAHGVDHTRFAARIARQPRVPGRVEVFG